MLSESLGQQRLRLDGDGEGDDPEDDAKEGDDEQPSQETRAGHGGRCYQRRGPTTAGAGALVAHFAGS